MKHIFKWILKLRLQLTFITGAVNINALCMRLLHSVKELLTFTVESVQMFSLLVWKDISYLEQIHVHPVSHKGRHRLPHFHAVLLVHITWNFRWNIKFVESAKSIYLFWLFLSKNLKFDRISFSQRILATINIIISFVFGSLAGSQQVYYAKTQWMPQRYRLIKQMEHKLCIKNRRICLTSWIF